jgi:putative ABC transport system permease protein
MFNAGDGAGAPRVALINQTMARRLWPATDPLGQRINTAMDGEEGSWVTVVGVVGDTPQQSIAVGVLPEMYRPFAQESLFPGDSMTITARVDGEPERMVPAFRAALAALNRDAPISDVRTMESVGRASVARQRSAGQMLGLLAGLALALAAVGLYGLLAYLVDERTREIGIRLALGARPLDVLLHVLRGGLRLAAVGIVAGLVLAGALTRVLSGLLYTVSATDPVTFALVVGVLIGAAACASYVPAWRATRVDPIVALRCD